jgi:hypothetical protein
MDWGTQAWVFIFTLIAAGAGVNASKNASKRYGDYWHKKLTTPAPQPLVDGYGRPILNQYGQLQYGPAPTGQPGQPPAEPALDRAPLPPFLVGVLTFIMFDAAFMIMIAIVSQYEY